MWPDSDSTEDLLGAARGGAPEAVERLLAAHRSALRRLVAVRMSPKLARRIDASDVVQEALVVAARRLPEYLGSPRIPFAQWLRRIARDRLADEARRHEGADKRALDREEDAADPRHAGSTLDLLAQVADSARTPAASVMRRELQARFAQALLALEEDDREIVHLRHGEQLGNREAAQVLGLSDAAAAMRWLRALKRLRLVLEAQDGERGRER